MVRVISGTTSRVLLGIAEPSGAVSEAGASDGCQCRISGAAPTDSLHTKRPVRCHSTFKQMPRGGAYVTRIGSAPSSGRLRPLAQRGHNQRPLNSGRQAPDRPGQSTITRLALNDSTASTSTVHIPVHIPANRARRFNKKCRKVYEKYINISKYRNVFMIQYSSERSF